MLKREFNEQTKKLMKERKKLDYKEGKKELDYKEHIIRIPYKDIKLKNGQEINK